MRARRLLDLDLTATLNLRPSLHAKAVGQSLAMLSHHLINATGLVALSLNVGALLRPGDRTLLKIGSWASALWAVNSLLIGAPTAAALSALSVGRQASALALQDRPGWLKVAAFLLFMGATLVVSALTWHGAYSLFPAAGSLVGTFAMFWLRGTRLRAAMVLVSALWLVSAVAYVAWWQIVANGLSGGAAAFSAWRGRRD